MPIIQGTASIAASAVNDNVITGNQFEFLPYNALLEFGLNGDANGADLRCDIFSGQDLVSEQLTPSIQNRAPVYPDDYVGQDVAAAGERIKIRVRNTSAAGARTIFFAVRITPV